MSFFPGFTRRWVRINGIRMHVWEGGQGAPLVLLHGYPQSGTMWRKVAPALARGHRVLIPDLRGYGDTDKPRDGYDKRTMADDVHQLALALGHPQYAVVAHDRGARVGHRLALDQPDAVRRLVVLDIVPTLTVFRAADERLAAAYWHWFFLQVPDLPELMIQAAAEPWLRHMLRSLAQAPDAFEEEAVADYLRVLRLPGTIRAGCEDYRAAATVDLAHDEADLGRKVHCPLLALWGEHGRMHTLFDVLATWQARAREATGRALPCGHFIPEEAPEALLAELEPFLRA